MSCFSAVVSKTFEELGLLKERFTQFTFGILVLEDISGIIMMVMLSTIAAAGAAISPAFWQKEHQPRIAANPSLPNVPAPQR